MPKRKTTFDLLRNLSQQDDETKTKNRIRRVSLAMVFDASARGCDIARAVDRTYQKTGIKNMVLVRKETGQDGSVKLGKAEFEAVDWLDQKPVDTAKIWKDLSGPVNPVIPNQGGSISITAHTSNEGLEAEIAKQAEKVRHQILEERAAIVTRAKQARTFNGHCAYSRIHNALEDKGEGLGAVFAYISTGWGQRAEDLHLEEKAKELGIPVTTDVNEKPYVAIPENTWKP